MSADDDLRLAWQAHREGRAGRRDALLTLAVASAEPEGAAWVGAVRDYLVAAHPGHLYSGFYALDEALGDRRVVKAIARLRLVFPEARVRRLLQSGAVLRGPYPGCKAPIALLLDDLLAPSRATPRGGAARLGDVTPAPRTETPESILSFYLNVLLGVAALCKLAMDDARDGKRAA